ncbi:hypothetical protein BC835DRAFT_1416570 [Cytidiella melzeri]|nr:hypothetical protein BC835DRAFT_1416570 [Cytidiella melzeri]
METGLKPEDVRITTSLPQLRGASVAGLVRAYDFLSGPDGRDLIKMSWRKSKAKEWCLSEKCLTSKAARSALNDYLKCDPSLRDEIEARLGTVRGLDDTQPSDENEIDHFVDDDSDVPLSAVINETVGQRVSEHTERAKFTVNSITRGDAGLGLVAAGPDEDVWQFDDEGQRWIDTGELPAEEVDNDGGDDGDNEEE